MRTLLLILIATSAWAVQSIQLTTQNVASSTFPAQSGNWRIEIGLHDWGTPTNGTVIAEGAATGAYTYFVNSSGSIFIQSYNTLETGASDNCNFTLATFTTQVAYLRIQHDATAKTDSCEIWDSTGTLIDSKVTTYTSISAGSTGISIGRDAGQSRGVSFFRVQSTLVALSSAPPVAANQTDALLLWAFEGNLNDTMGSYNGTLSAGSPTYVTTPATDPVAIIRTVDAPVWGSWRPMRVGATGYLTGASSYSQGSSPTVTCAWAQLSGPSTLSWSNTSSCTPTVTGHVFGDYELQLTVTDADSSTDVATEHIGAVAMDSRGVVIQSDSKVTDIFGPMIALGYNPWGYADERALTATRLRWQAYQDQGLVTPSWETPQAGTVSYIYNGRSSVGATPTTLCAAIADATTTSIVVCDAARLDLSELPTRIFIGNIGSWEEVRICSTTGSSGEQTLTVCYDGRGQAGGYRVAAKAWGNGTSVGQMRVNGSGTQFLTVMCPAGAGPAGLVTYSTGTVTLTHGSASVTGNGTSWSTANNVIAGYALRVTATHGGVPFVFHAPISSVGGTTSITLARAFPADADDGTYSYQIVYIDNRHAVLYYTRADASTAKTYFQTSGCESDTAMYLYQGHDTAQNGTTQSAKSYSYTDGFGYTSAFGANFYGEGMAHRALYYRSGLRMALDAATAMDDNYAKSPFVAGGDIGGIPLLIGGGVIGSFVNAILNPGRVAWTDLRGLANMGAIGATGCNDIDTRDSGYKAAWLTLAANYDPDPTERATWKTKLAAVLTRDQNCKRSDNSWANGFVFNTGSPALTLTNGSATVTGTGLTSGLCFGIASGSVSVTSESASFTGTGLVNGSKIIITGTRGGQPFTGAYQFTQSGGASGSLSALWPGDTGTATYVIENNGNMSAIGVNNDDTQLTKNWACTWNSSTQLTLNRAWDGPSGSNYHIYSYGLAGYGQQPYMLGIKSTVMKWASQNDDPDIAAGYATLLPLATAWIKSTGYDSVTQGMHYGRIYEYCEPATAPAGVFDYRTPGCNFGLNPSAVRAARVLNGEVTSALRVPYEATPSADNKDWGDKVYGSIWGYAPYTTGGVYSDSNYVRDENSDGALAAYKWTGFFFGMGMAHQWPAVRLGVARPQFAGGFSIGGAWSQRASTALSWASLTSGQWAALTSAQWSALTN